MANLRANNLTGTGGRNAIDGSVYFSNDAVDYLSVGSAGDFNFLHNGASDFAAEFWVRPGKDNDRQTVFSTGGNSSQIGFACRIMEDGASGGSNGYKVLCQFSRGASGNYLGFLGGTLDVGSWSHVALEFTTSNKQLAIYINGQLTNSSDLDGTANGTFGSGNFSSSNSSYALTIGRENYSTEMYLDGGFVSNFRICKGHIVYNGAFTPPTQKLELHKESVLLCCQDSDNPLQEATGKTITGFGNLAAFSSGDNLVTNGTFDSATTGWTSDGTVAIDSNRLKITNDAANYRSAHQDITVVVGKAYRVSADCIAGTSNNSNFHVGTTSSSNALASAATSPVVVRPTVTTMRVTLNVGSNTPGHTALYDNVEAREVEPPKAQKVLPSVGIDEGVVFDGYTKMNSQGVMYFPTGDTTQRGRGRGVFAGGYTSVPSDAALKRIYYIEIDSMGTSAEFGDTNKAAAWGQSGCSSSTRGLITGGTNPANLNTIDYITIAAASNALDFGDLSVTHGYTASCSNNTRGLTGGGRGNSPTQRLAQIDYNTIATLGNGQDFGDLTQSRMGLGAVASSTRAVFTGGNGSPADPSTVYNIIDYVEFATTGNATDFGDMTDEHTYHGSCSSSTRGIIYGGVTSYGPSVTTNIIEYVTIASTGNGTDFGDVRDDGAHAHGTSNGIRGVFAGGVDPYRNSIDFVTISTTGNGVDWGDLPDPNGSYAYAAGLSDSHGGLS